MTPDPQHLARMVDLPADDPPRPRRVRVDRTTSTRWPSGWWIPLSACVGVAIYALAVLALT